MVAYRRDATLNYMSRFVDLSYATVALHQAATEPLHAYLPQPETSGICREPNIRHFAPHCSNARSTFCIRPDVLSVVDEVNYDANNLLSKFISRMYEFRFRSPCGTRNLCIVRYLKTAKLTETDDTRKRRRETYEKSHSHSHGEYQNSRSS